MVVMRTFGGEGMGTSTQMNFRIDASLKAEGDAALLGAGVTPSEAVRSLWRFASRHSTQPREIRHALELDDPSSSADQEREARRKIATLRRGRDGLREGYAQLGIPYVCPQKDKVPSGNTGEQSLSELRELALLDRQMEKGLA